jgi:hypothetical protein
MHRGCTTSDHAVASPARVLGFCGNRGGHRGSSAYPSGNVMVSYQPSPARVVAALLSTPPFGRMLRLVTTLVRCGTQEAPVCPVPGGRAGRLDAPHEDRPHMPAQAVEAISVP